MGKYIHRFQTEQEFEDQYYGSGYTEPWLSYTEGKGTNYNITAEERFNGHDYVDLGFTSGLLWATANVGANNPEERGDCFAWGETEAKESYTTSTYKFGAARPYTKYDEDGKTVLEMEDDAARVNMGGMWRTPTMMELVELSGKTTQSVEVVNGVNCVKFTSKTNNNYIIIPCLGNILSGGTNNDNDLYTLQGADLNTGDKSRKTIMSGRYRLNDGTPTVNQKNPRIYGLPVRGVIG